VTVGLVVGCPDGSPFGSVLGLGLYDDEYVGSAEYGPSLPLCPFSDAERIFRPTTPSRSTPSTTKSAISPPRLFFGGRGPPGGAPQPNCGCPGP
jgi:hypothetical protein